MLFDHRCMDPSPQFSVITIFTTALCNLNCSYCYICKDKNGGLKQIDDDIKRCFDENLYIKQVLDLDPNCHNSITGLSLWGGEPLLEIYRLTDHMKDFFENFPNLEMIDFSTNMTLSDHPQRIQALIDAVEDNYHLLNISSIKKKFKIDFQISIDGYEEMNDFTRGNGDHVTERIYKNWKTFVETVKFDDSKILIDVRTKSTFSPSSWHFVNTPEKAYKWCEAFNRILYEPWHNANKNIIYNHGSWNNAMPAEYSQKDGIEYAKVTKSFIEIYDDVIKNLDSFKHYSTIIPEAGLSISLAKDQYGNDFSKVLNFIKCKRCGMGCGVFAFNLVPIPNGKFTMCHRGLFDSYTDYINNLSQQEHLNGLANLWSSIDAKKYWVYNKEEILRMHHTINKLYEYKNQSFYTDAIQQIKAYADSGIIDSKYQDINEIIPTLSVLLINSQCIQDCFIFGGSWTTRTPLEIPLFYNGSMDLIMEEIKRNVKGFPI